MADPKTLVESYLEASERGDQAAMLAAFADDFVYHVFGRSPVSGVTEGQSAALDYYRKMVELSDGTYELTGVEDLMTSENAAALVVNETVERKGKSLNWKRVVLFKFRGDLISEISLLDDKRYELDELLSS